MWSRHGSINATFSPIRARFAPYNEPMLPAPMIVICIICRGKISELARDQATAMEMEERSMPQFLTVRTILPGHSIERVSS